MSEVGAGADRVYLPFLDGMRALAAMYVVGHHLWQFAISSGDVPPRWFEAFSIFKYGTFAVAVFLVISGYCLMLPIARRGTTRLPGGFGPFAVRRAKRLLPAYFLVLFSSIVLIGLTPSLRSASGSPWDITLPNPSYGAIGSHVLLVHNWVEEWRWSIDPPMWSIALELQIYVVFAVALLPLVRSIGSRRTAAVAFALSLALVAAGFGFAHPWMLGLFAVGVVAVEMTVTGRRPSLRDGAWLTGAAVAVVVAIGADELITNAVVGSLVSEVVVGFAAAVAIVVTASQRPSRSGTGDVAYRVGQALSWRPLCSLGRASYSLYLVHYPIVAFLHLTVVDDRGWGVPASLLALTAVSIPAIAVVTAAVFYSVERPLLHRPVASRARETHVADRPLDLDAR